MRYTRRMTWIAGVAALCVGIGSAASAAPISPSHVRVDYGPELVIVDVFGGTGDHGVAGGEWDPLTFANITGQIQRVSTMGGETAAADDDFTRYWVELTQTVGVPPRWTMTGVFCEWPGPRPPGGGGGGGGQTPGTPVPEPGTLLLLGSGLIGVATSARRYWRRA